MKDILRFFVMGILLMGAVGYFSVHSFIFAQNTQEIVAKDAVRAGKEIRENYDGLDKNGIKENISEAASSLSKVFKKLFDSTIKPLLKFFIQVSISVFKFIISLLQSLGSTF